jgi:lipoprotein-anchoring transpeptidase ErfK/SrfK
MKMLSRRRFLHLAALSLGGLALRPLRPLFQLPEFPPAERLGRVVVGRAEVRSAPDSKSDTVKYLYEDTVVPWLRELVGKSEFRFNQRWVETPEGYVWSPYLQFTRLKLNQPLKDLPQTSEEPGLWVEVTVPYVNVALHNPPPRGPSLKEWVANGHSPRLYYSQVLWLDEVRVDESGQVWYRLKERFGSYGDIFWGPAEAFRPINAEEISPINPEAEEKRVVVDVTYQTLSCFEGNREVYFARISTGGKFDASGNPSDKWSTPLGTFRIWRKAVSTHMSGGAAGGGWDVSGVAWTTLFTSNGVAVHSTYWHNNYGVPMSRGCVNALPEDAKWVFRWTLPQVDYDPGNLIVEWPGGTQVQVIER